MKLRLNSVFRELTEGKVTCEVLLDFRWDKTHIYLSKWVEDEAAHKTLAYSPLDIIFLLPSTLYNSLHRKVTKPKQHHRSDYLRPYRVSVDCFRVES